MKKITNELIKESIDKNINTFRKKALSGKVSGQDVAKLFGFGELYETEETVEDGDITPLMECWRQKYLTLEGKYDPSMENPDNHKTDETFKDADEYEKWMKEREKIMSELEPKEVNENEDDIEEEDEEENLIEKIDNLKEKLVSTLEDVISKKDDYEEDEIKNSIQLLYSIDPEKVSEEDVALINSDSEENVENTEEVEEN
jgi:hypothetical protein